MLSTKTIFAAALCTMAFAAMAQTNPTFSVVQTSESAGTYAEWTPQHIYAVDVNNDGIPDIVQDGFEAVNDHEYVEESVFGVSISNGDGTFKPAVEYSSPGALNSPMAFGDFNGDGKIDIAMPGGIGTVAVYLGNGDGTFQEPLFSVIPTSSGPFNFSSVGSSSFAAADFNHDGNLDLAIVGTDLNVATVYILPGQGNGLFLTATAVLTVPVQGGAAGWGIPQMLTGDFDGDTNADLAVVATTGSSTGGIGTETTHVLYGAGDFSFEDTTISGQVAAMNSGDLNSDGRTDLFGIDLTSNNLDIYYGQSDRTFAAYTQPPPAGTSQYMTAPAMADFNNDGLMDIVTVTSNSPSGTTELIFYLGTSSPGQFDPQTWNVENASGIIPPPVAGDFNHDGEPDWIISSAAAAQASTFFVGLNDTTQGGLWSDCAYPSTALGINVCSPAVTSGSTVNFNATAHSLGQLRKMEVWVDGVKLGEQYHTWEGNAWFNFSTTLAPGTHQATYYAADVDNTLQRSDFTFSVPGSCSAPSAPGVNICSPANNSTTASGQLLVQASSQVTGALDRMEIWLDSTKEYTETDSTTLSAYVNASPGTHTITVYAVNEDGTLWDASTTVNVP